MFILGFGYRQKYRQVEILQLTDRPGNSHSAPAHRELVGSLLKLSAFAPKHQSKI
jgi:hypothetical protein